MKRLRYDRPIALGLKAGEGITVPETEVWSVFLAARETAAVDQKDTQYRSRIVVGGGTSIMGGNVITGIAFKEVV